MNARGRVVLGPTAGQRYGVPEETLLHVTKNGEPPILPSRHGGATRLGPAGAAVSG